MKKAVLATILISFSIVINISPANSQMVSSVRDIADNLSSSSLIYGAVSHWNGGTTPSCIYPNFHTDSILVTVPAGINITFFTVDFAYVSSTAISHQIPISDGIFYFSTKCGQTDTLSCDNPGDTAGVCYLIPNQDFHTSLLPCITPSCNPQSFWVYAHLARRYAGIGCDTFSIWYSQGSYVGFQYYFSAYVGGTPILALSHTVTTDTTPCGGTAKVTANGGVAPFTYIWSPGGQTTDSIGSLCNGTYCCTVTDSKGCTDSVCVVLSKSTGIKTIGNSSKISFYPDPNKGRFVISGVSNAQIINIYNALGQKLNSTITDKETMYFDISNQPNGVYLIRILNKDGSLAGQKKIVKE